MDDGGGTAYNICRVCNHLLPTDTLHSVIFRASSSVLQRAFGLHTRVHWLPSYLRDSFLVKHIPTHTVTTLLFFNDGVGPMVGGRVHLVLMYLRPMNAGYCGRASRELRWLSLCGGSDAISCECIYFSPLHPSASSFYNLHLMGFIGPSTRRRN